VIPAPLIPAKAEIHTASPFVQPHLDSWLLSPRHSREDGNLYGIVVCAASPWFVIPVPPRSREGRNPYGIAVCTASPWFVTPQPPSFPRRQEWR